MPDITYKISGVVQQNIRVYLEGKHIGTIKPITNGFAYYPLGSRTQGATSYDPEIIKKELEESLT
jgi:hypothetical protein